MLRRTRNRLCIWVIVGGLSNFLAYTIVYAGLGGDAKNGEKGSVINARGEADEVFYIRGHFIHGSGGRSREVSRAVWIYSYLHSISVWPTHGAMIISMLILARPHIIATMRESNWIRGPTFITVCITLTALACSVLTLWFSIHFVQDLLA